MGKSHIGSGSVSPGAIVASKSARFDFNDVGQFASGIELPANHRILDIIVDINQAWDSGTSDAMEVGVALPIAAQPDRYADVADLQVDGRSVVTISQSQAVEIQDIGGQDIPVQIEITSIGAPPTEGIGTLTILYATNEDNF